jgi:hypothetical protein
LDTGAELLQNIIEEAQRQHVDINDAVAVQAMLQQPGVYARLREQAAAHGFGTASFDSAAAAVSLGIGRVAAKTLRAGRPLRAGGAVAGGLGAGAVMSGAGEATGNVLAGKPFDPVPSSTKRYWDSSLTPCSKALVLYVSFAIHCAARSVPGDVPELTDTVGDFEEGDLPGSFPGVQPPSTCCVVARHPCLVWARAALKRSPSRRFLARCPVKYRRPTSTSVFLASKRFTIRAPAEIITDAEGRILASRRLEYQPNPPLVAGPLGVGTPEAMEQAQFEARNAPEFAQLDIRNPENVNQWLADHGVVLESKEQMDAIANVVAAPATQRQAAIADSIDGLALSRETGAEALTDALMAMSRILPKDPVRKINIAQELNITPEQVPSVVASALALEIQAAIEGGVTNATEPTTAQPTTPAAAAIEADDDPLVKAPIVHARRGLTRGESVPFADLGSLARQLGGLGSSQAAGSAQAPQVQPGGGLRARGPQAGTTNRGLTRESGPVAGGSEAGNRVVADDTRRPRGNRGLKKAAERQRQIDLPVMTKEKYEETYPGRNYDDDLNDVIDSNRERTADESEFLNAGQLQALRGDTASVLQYLGSVMQSPMARLVANQIRALGLKLPPITFDAFHPDAATYRVTRLRDANGAVIGTRPEIIVNPNTASLEAVLHEYVHAATMGLLLEPQTAAHVQARKKLEALRAYVEARVPGLAGTDVGYGLTNVYEFVAEALTRGAFQKELNKLKLPGTATTVWQAFKRLVMEILGIEKSDSVLSEVLLTASNLFSGVQYGPTGFARRSYEMRPGSKADSIRLDSPAKLAEKRRAAVPSTAIVGMKDGARTYIAYQPKGKPDATYTLYATVNDPRGDPATKIEKMTRAEVEDYMRAAGSEVIAPAADTRITPGIPTNTEKRLVGFSPEGDLRAAGVHAEGRHLDVLRI